MEIFVTCCLALLEATFIMVGLLLLHSLRRQIGSAAFYLAIGLLLIFTQLVSVTGLKVVTGFPGADFYIASTILFLPYLAALLVIYATEGTVSAQRLIIGAIFALGFYVYISYLTQVQCTWAGFKISQGPSADSLAYLLGKSQKTMAASIVAQALDLFLIPIFFQRLKNAGCRIFICILGALMLTQIVDSFIYATVLYWGEPSSWWFFIESSYIAKAFATIWLSVIVGIYLSKIEKERPGEGRGTLDIVFAFLGSYGRARDLQRNVQEWEGRYRTVIEHASDIILLLNREGVILDANQSAINSFAAPDKESLIGKTFSSFLVDTDQHPSMISSLWTENFKPDETHFFRNLQYHAKSLDGRILELDCSVSVIKIEAAPMLIMFARDFSERNRMNREREELQEQLGHAQRLESVGQLAGGVAHDFNNYIHAIQGHLDILTYMHGISDPKIEKHLDNINKITIKAEQLTKQLVGFARKGKYKIEVIDLEEMIKETARLFSPASQENIDLSIHAPRYYMYVKGDRMQLEQAFLNIFINARDALESKNTDNMKIQVTLDAGDKFRDQLIPLDTHGNRDPGDFYCVIISDNGTGMDKAVLDQIFDPFFTTKPFGKGTGMGLSMVYGTITNHNGLISAESNPGKGTTFYVFLPRHHDK